MLARLAPVIAAALVFAACGSNTTPQAASLSSTSTTVAASLATTTSLPADAQSTTTVAPAPPDFTRFIAAVDAALADSAYAGAALSDPEVFVATGQLFCELLDDGASEDDILSEHLDALAAVGDGEVRDADAAATGIVLGASIETICPQHAGQTP